MRRGAALGLALLALAPGSPANAAEPRRLTLAEAVELALKIDPSVAEARIAVDRSKLAVLRAQLDRVTVTIDGTLREAWSDSSVGSATQYGCNLSGIPLPLDPTRCSNLNVPGLGQGAAYPITTAGLQGNSNLAAQINLPLFSGFRVSSNVTQKKRLEDTAGVSVRQARRDTALAVARAYWAVRRIELTRDAVQAALARVRDSEAVVAGRVQAGLAPPIDGNRALTRRLQQEATALDLGGQARESSVQLAALLGVEEEVVLVDPPDVPAGPPALDDLVESALKARPEVARARLLYAAQEQLVRIARADYFPQLSAFGLFQYGNNQFNPSSGASSFSTENNPLANLSGSIQAGLLLRMNFFNMLNTYTSVGDARFELARLGEEIRLARRTIVSDVRVAHEKLGHLYRQRAPLLLAIDVARDNVSIVQARYQNGEALVIELFDAQVDLATVERQLADLAAQRRLAGHELDAALGGTAGLSS